MLNSGNDNGFNPSEKTASALMLSAKQFMWDNINEHKRAHLHGK